ncbi:hypothetical protein K3495_g15897 [Podosphaera aphanis]|nr:hypothetical protein K3495_g15897 [Podosphaera aphanis]
MRSLFRHLEDPKVPEEIKSLNEFLAALKQRCQDPGLEERASRTIDSLSMGNSSFHQFITVFEDNMADSTYADQDKSQWRVMLRRRLSPKLKDALVMATDIPKDYHEFVAYLRQKDAGFHEARSTNIPLSSTHAPPSSPRILPLTPSFPEYKELTVSQGGTAMDLDAISQQKGEDGRLTQEAKDARRALGQCIWCNRSGHFAINCPLGSRGRTPAPTKQEAQLKDQLQH